MKKLVTLIAAAVLSAGTFAQTKLLNSVNIALPLTFKDTTVDAGSDVDLNYKNVSVDADYTGAYILKNNVMFTYGAQAGYTHEEEDDDDDGNFSFDGFNFGLRAGAGYAFVNSEKMLLSASAFTGFNYSTADADESGCTITDEIMSIPLGLSFYGANYFGGKKTGLFYGVDISYDLAVSTDLNFDYGSWGSDGYSYDVNSSITITPKVGFAFAF